VGHYVYIKNKKTKALEPGHWPPKKKTEAVLTWLACGNLVQTAAITGVPHVTIKNWRMQPWWKDAVDTFHADDKQELDVKYQKIIRKALDVVDDRLDNGNFMLDQKTGKILRVPVNLRDSHVVMKDLVAQQQVLRKDQKVEQITNETVNDKLLKLATQFAEMAMGKKEKVIEPLEGDYSVEPIPEPTQTPSEAAMAP